FSISFSLLSDIPESARLARYPVAQEEEMILSGKRVLLAYKNFAANRNISHIGLGVAAMNTAKVLRSQGIAAEVLPVINAADLNARLDASVSHAVVSAPWIPTVE